MDTKVVYRLKSLPNESRLKVSFHEFGGKDAECFVLAFAACKSPSGFSNLFSVA